MFGFGTVGTVAFVFVLALVVLAVLNRRAFMRLVNAGKVQAGSVGRWASNQSPLEQLKEKVDERKETITKSQKGLEGVKVQIASYKRRVAEETEEIAVLDSRLKTAMANGDKRNTATEYALQLGKAEENLKLYQSKLANAEVDYENYRKQVESNQAKVRELEQEAKDLGVELDMSELDKSNAELASSFNAGMGNDDEDIATIREKVRSKIDANRAVGEVARDLNRHGIAQAEDEEDLRKAKAASILDRYKVNAEVK